MDSPPETAGNDEGKLREALRSWRLQKARQLGMPPYTLFWDRTLDELCAQASAHSRKICEPIWGIGEQKCRKFGAEIIALIASSSVRFYLAKD